MRRRHPSGWKLEIAAVAILLAVFCFWPGGAGLHAYRLRENDRFMESTLPALDHYKQTTGRYPSTLREVTNESFSAYFPEDGGYSSDGESFTFHYYVPGDPSSGLMHTDSHRTWERKD